MRALRLFSLLLAATSLATVAVLAQTGTSSARPPLPGAHREPPMCVLVPAYFYPASTGPDAPWTRLRVAAAAHPGRVWAVGNPASGPGIAVDPAYTAVFDAFRASGGELLAYVHTSYAARPLAEVQAEIDTWLQMYAVDGFFLDEMSTTPGDEAYYLAVRNHVETYLPGAPVVANPGTSTSPSFLFAHGKSVASSLCIYEQAGDFLAWSSDAWVGGLSATSFYALPHTTPPGSWPAYVDHARAQGCGFFYCTDDALPNPWDTLPPFFESLVAYVDAAY